VTMLPGSLASVVSNNDNVLAEETTTVSDGKVRQGKEEQKGVGLKEREPGPSRGNPAVQRRPDLRSSPSHQTCCRETVGLSALSTNVLKALRQTHPSAPVSSG
jgi:hypothetical protein